MNGPIVAAALSAAALLSAGGRPGAGRLAALAIPPADPAVDPVASLRVGWAVVGGLAIAALGWVTVGGAGGAAFGVGSTVAAVALIRWRASRLTRDEPDGAELAGGWELLGVCLEVGLPVPIAVQAAAERITGTTGDELRRVAGLLELGADPAEAWRGCTASPALSPFGRAARRSAVTGAALAHVTRAEAVRLRAGLVDTAQARAQRAAVLITGPLGLCFLPAFVVLGIVPVVIGLAGDALAHW